MQAPRTGASRRPKKNGSARRNRPPAVLPAGTIPSCNPTIFKPRNMPRQNGLQLHAIAKPPVERTGPKVTRRTATLRKARGLSQTPLHDSAAERSPAQTPAASPWNYTAAGAADYMQNRGPQSRGPPHGMEPSQWSGQSARNHAPWKIVHQSSRRNQPRPHGTISAPAPPRNSRTISRRPLPVTNGDELLKLKAIVGGYAA